VLFQFLLVQSVKGHAVWWW